MINKNINERVSSLSISGDNKSFTEITMADSFKQYSRYSNKINNNKNNDDYCFYDDNNISKTEWMIKPNDNKNDDKNKA